MRHETGSKRHETKEKRRLNKMDQWWLGTAPSGLELAGEADSPAKVYYPIIVVRVGNLIVLLTIA